MAHLLGGGAGTQASEVLVCPPIVAISQKETTQECSVYFDKNLRLKKDNDFERIE